jgi:Kef-type K+ transport system membrane component KefB
MTLGTLFLIVIAGLVGPLLSGFRRFSIPLLVGEIGAGIAIGTSGLGWLNPADPTLQFLSSVGFAMLMFLVGIKLPLREPGLRQRISHSLWAVLLAFGLSIPIGLLLAHVTPIHNAMIFILLCACSSTSLVMPMIHERKLGGKTVTLTGTWVAIADTATIVALPLAFSQGNLLSIGFGALLVTAVATGGLIGLKWFKTSDFGDRLRDLSKERGWALDMRLSIGLLFGLAALATKFGTSVLVAGFAAGAVAMLVGQPKRFQKQLIGLAEGFFVPLFFVALGAKLDIVSLVHSPENLILSGAIVLGSLVVHVLVSRLIGLPLASGLAATSMMGLPIAVVSIGLNEGFLHPGQGAAIIAAALLSLVVSSLGVIKLSKYSAQEVPPPPPPPSVTPPGPCNCQPNVGDGQDAEGGKQP